MATRAADLEESRFAIEHVGIGDAVRVGEAQADIWLLASLGGGMAAERNADAANVLLDTVHESTAHAVHSKIQGNGFEDLVARDKNHYAQIALSLGLDHAKRTIVEQRLAVGCDRIFDDQTFLDAAETFLMEATAP